MKLMRSMPGVPSATPAHENSASIGPPHSSSAASIDAPPTPSTGSRPQPSLGPARRRSAVRRRVARYLAERDVAVSAALTGHAEDALADHVARHLRRAAPDLSDLAHHEVDAGVPG